MNRVLPVFILVAVMWLLEIVDLALPGDLPAYEDLAAGAEGPLVAQLQKALQATGAKKHT